MANLSDVVNVTELITNIYLSNDTNTTVTETETENVINNLGVQGIFGLLYLSIFILGIVGNVLVCFVVFRNKAMQTVTNLFITNLALSDILLCGLAVPFTPMYTFLQGWIFGRAMCHIVPYAQGVSVYISTLTLTSIAIDRFFVIIYPFHPRMKLSTCFLIIVSIWLVALMITLPYGLFVKFSSPNDTATYFCEESWPAERYRQIFGTVTTTLQFILPFLFMSICYISVSIRLNDRAKARIGNKTSKKEEADRDRKKRTNRMLISMVAVFGISWLPLNTVNMFNDFYSNTDEWQYYNLLFFLAHCIAMSSTCYNPFLYAWLNENFRKEFKQVLPCIDGNNHHNSNNGRERLRNERTFINGNETLQETLLGTTQSKVSQIEIIPRGPTVDDVDIRKSPKNIQTILLKDTEANNSQQKQETIVLPSGVLETPFDTTIFPTNMDSQKRNGESDPRVLFLEPDIKQVYEG